MKKLVHIFALSALALFTAVSCQKEAEKHVPGAPDVDGCYGVYFPAQEAAGSHTYDPQMDPSVTLTVARLRSTGSITVPVVVTASEENIFHVENIVFEDGQTETTFDIDFPEAVEGTQYSIHLEIQDPQYVSIYNDKPFSIDFSVLRVQWQDLLNPKTGEPAVITLNEGWWGETHLAQMKYYEVNGLRTCQIYSIEEGGIWGDTVDATLEFKWYTKNNNGEGNNLLEVSKQYFGFDYDDWTSKPVGEATSPIFVYDYYWYHVERGTSGIDQFTWMEFAQRYGDPDGSYPIGYYDGNGGFYFTLRYYIPGLGGFGSDPYEFVAIVDGYTRVDYSIDLETDYSSEGVSPILATVGPDVKSIKYAIYEGSLNAVQIEARATSISNGEEPGAVTIDEIEYDEDADVYYSYFGVSPETTGTFTLVAVGFDEKNGAQEFDSVEFFFVSADDQEEYAVPVSVFTEATPARYEKLNPYDSFAYGISAQGATEIHVGLFTQAQIENYGYATVLNTVKSRASYALSDEKVAEANQDGGYYTVASGLAANTVYYVVVWATNGALENSAYAAYKTDRLPYVWNSIGQGTLTDGFIMPLFGEDDVTVTCDVYEEASTPGLYMITGFQLQLCALFYGASEEELAPYEGQNWFNAEIVVDATDPTAVHIGEQEYGIYVNSTYGYVLIDSEASGTLENGVITWPAREMYVGLTASGWYYGNTNGTFAITLPESASTSAVSAPATGMNKKASFNLVNAEVWDKPEVKYERDPKAISVKTVELGNPSFDKKSGRESVLDFND